MRYVPATWTMCCAVFLGLLEVGAAGKSIHPSQPTFLENAQGQPALVTDSWDLKGTDFQGIGQITSVVRCGDEMFLADRQARIRRYDLKQRKAIGEIGVSPDEERLQRPWALAPDCAGQVLYVADGALRAVFSYRLPTGVFQKKHALPRSFRVGRSAEYVPSGHAYISGLSYPDQNEALSFRTLDFNRFFEPFRLGVSVKVETGEVARGFEPYEQKCISGSSCPEIIFSRVNSGGPIGWVVAHAGSEHVALYGVDDKHISSIDIRSPLFLRARPLPQGALAREYVVWRRENSEIDNVFAFDKVIATTHMTSDVPPDWGFGQPLKYRVLLNLHSFKGERLVSDILLPDRAVGRDDQHIYVVEYGKDGRLAESPSVRLHQIPIRTGKGGFRPRGSQ